MLEKLKDIVSRSGKAAGVEMVLGDDGQVIYHLVLLARKKSVISVQLTKTGMTDVARLKEWIPRQVPVVLSVTGRGVLFKQAPADTVKDALLALVLPNARPDDFYISTLRGQANFVFLARKDRIDLWISALEKEGVPVVSLLMGIAGLSSVIPFVESDAREFQAGGYRFAISAGRVASVQFASGDSSPGSLCRVGGEEVESRLIPAFGGAFEWLAYHSLPEEESVRNKCLLWREKLVFQRLGLGALVFFASTLFLNLTAFFYLSGENAELGARNSSVLEGIKKMERLETEFRWKEGFLKEAGWVNASKTSYYADQIAASVPPTILLRRLVVNPENISESRKEKRMIFESGSILVEGTCKDPVVLNPWLGELKGMSWVTGIVSKKYQYDHKNKAGVFELEIRFSP